MSGDWLKMRCDLWDDPRVAALCDKLGSSEAAVIGGLYRLWTIADQHSVDGLLVAMTPTALDRKTGLPGFSDAMEAIGWLTKESGGLQVPRFNEHNGESAKQRALAAKRQNKARHADVTQPSRNQRDENVTGALPRDRRQSSVFNHQSSEAKALLEEIKDKIPSDWFATTGEPLKFDGADGSEVSVFDPISREDMLADPKAMHDWWRYQLRHPAPVLGRETVWCLIALALGLKFANPKKRWRSRLGVWSTAVGSGQVSQA